MARASAILARVCWVQGKPEAARKVLELVAASAAEANNPLALLIVNSAWAALSEREPEVLRLIAEGLANKAIAKRLELAPSTVKWYVNERIKVWGIEW